MLHINRPTGVIARELDLASLPLALPLTYH